MEQQRLLIAIGISFGIFFLWSMFFAPKAPQAPPDDIQEQAQNQAPGGDETAATPATTEAPPPVVEQTTQPGRRITVDSPLYRMVFSEQGGAVVSVVLKQYRETMADEAPLKELIHKDTAGGSVLAHLSGMGGQDLEQAVFTSEKKSDTIEVSSEATTLRFQHQSPSGLIVEKIYTFDPESYLIDLKVTLFNGGEHAYQGTLAMGLQNIPDAEAARLGFEGPSGFIDNELQQVKIKKIEEQNQLNGEIRWVAIEGRYFMTSIIPKNVVKGHMALAVNGKTLKNQVVIDTDSIAPQTSQSFEYYIFMGPKSLSLLKSYQLKIDKAINFGWFDFLAKPCLMFMNFIYGFIPNYGIAIIILTLVSRGIFWPLAKKSYKSMGEMRKVQPLMQEIREKYKDDKARMNQETMTLYRTYKINPMGGCLPMLIQMPVFFALYRMLYSAIELRHAPFFGWVTDLSAPDRLFNFGFSIPFMDPPYGIPVLTILMGASMLLQQKMTPTPGDPAQAKMMMLMPVIFTFIFINFSSGLVLYWFVSNIFSMAQQYYTQKQAT